MIFLNTEELNTTDDWSKALKAQKAAIVLGYSVKWLDYQGVRNRLTIILPDEESAAMFKLTHL